MGFDGIRNNPKQLSRPMSRQAFRPGQWNGARIGSRSTTYIQNNFYGPSSTYRGWGDAWASYDTMPSPPRNDSNKMSVLGWIGLGTGLLGGILSLFGGKKDAAPAEQGAPENTAQSRAVTEQPVQPQQSETVQPVQTQPVNNESTVKTTPVSQEAPEEEIPTVDNFNWNSGFETYAMDEAVNGKSPTEEISGKINVTEKDQDGKAPKKFTLNDGGNTYTFEKIESADGKVSYKCTGCTGGKEKTYTQGNIYNCNMVGGKPVLIQPKNADGWGKGLDRSNPQ